MRKGPWQAARDNIPKVSPLKEQPSVRLPYLWAQAKVKDNSEKFNGEVAYELKGEC